MRSISRRLFAAPGSLSALLPASLALLACLGVGSSLLAAEPTLMWGDLYDGGAQYIDIGTAVLVDPQGNAIVGGESADGVDGSDMLVRKLDRSDGATLWTRRVPSGEINDMALSGMVRDDDGHILVGGYVRGCVG